MQTKKREVLRNGSAYAVDVNNKWIGSETRDNPSNSDYEQLHAA